MDPLLGLAADGYWELDAQLHCTFCVALEPGIPEALPDYLRANLAGNGPDAAQWRTVRDRLLRCERIRDFKVDCHVAPNAAWTVSIGGIPRLDVTGKFVAYRGVWRVLGAGGSLDWHGTDGESIFQHLSELSTDWYWEQDEQFRFVWFSPGVEQQTGRALTSMLGRTRWEVACARLDDPHWRAHFETLRRHEQFRDFEAAFLVDDGSLKWVNIRGVPKFDAGGHFRGYRGAATDITRRKTAEQAVLQSEERFRDFARACNDWMSETDTEGHYTWIWGPETEPGVPAAAYLGKRREELAAPNTDLTQEPWKSFRETLARREPFRDFRFAVRWAQGTDTILSVSGVPYFGTDGRFLGYRNVGSNITAQLETERAARVAHDRLATAIDHLNEAIALCDADDRFIMTNRGFREVNRDVAHYLEPGTSYLEMLRALLHKGYFPQAIGREAAWLEERMIQRRKPAGPFEVQRQGGRWLLISEHRLPNGCTLTYGIDITARKRTETEQLAAARSQRDALVREVHHRIKNNLQGVVGLLMQNMYEHPELTPLFRRAAAQVQLVAIVHGLQGRTAVGGVRVCELVPAIAHNVEGLTRTEIVVEVDVAPTGVWLAESESVAIALILNELMFNAIKHAKGEPVRLAVLLRGDHVVVTLRNRGTLASDFDFDAGVGIGTGLELVRALVPARGVWLTIAQDAPQIVAQLELAPPVVSI